ncbi:AcrR family transcriptional regulator [Rhodococcus sp. 27YEA15]|uniref:TetR/AcrR family transcriptional regulator n=1 Tax=Rhodococcus sp. 27YEA15 TaxID=3156259 RepID=UPI003C7B09FF
MDAAKRTRLSPAERRAQLIDLGARMLSERPLEQVSVEDIADRAGVSRGLLFHYFASKSDFHLEIIRHTSAQLLERTEPVEVDSDDPMLTLRSVIASYVDYVTENSTTYVSLLRGSASGDPQMRAVFEQTRDTMANRTLDQLPRIGMVRTPRAELAVRGWIAFVEEATISWLRAPSITRDELVELNVAALPALAFASAASDGSLN